MPSGLAAAATTPVLSRMRSKRWAFSLLPDLDQIAVGAGHQYRPEFDDRDARAERRVDAGHFEADDAATDDQHALRDLAQFEGAGRVDDARVVGHERQRDRLRAGGDDRLLEPDQLAAAVGQRDFEVMRVDELANALHDFDLAPLGHAGETAGQLADDLVLVARSLSRSMLGAAKLTPQSPMCCASSITPAMCSSAFDGMQPTLRQTPPSVA
jgi:hypothetical protein